MIGEYHNAEKALEYLARADKIPERSHGERMVLELLHHPISRLLDLGTGDGRLMALVKVAHPNCEGVALDSSQTMLDKAHERFRNAPSVTVHCHDLNESILSFGSFDAVVSSFAIHHLADSRKFELYKEILTMLTPGGVFVNLEHVSSPTEKLHDDFLLATGMTRETEDQTNQCTAVSTQVDWLNQIGFENADCFWKWRELAVFAGTKPANSFEHSNAPKLPLTPNT